MCTVLEIPGTMSATARKFSPMQWADVTLLCLWLSGKEREICKQVPPSEEGAQQLCRPLAWWNSEWNSWGKQLSVLLSPLRMAPAT